MFFKCIPNLIQEKSHPFSLQHPLFPFLSILTFPMHCITLIDNPAYKFTNQKWLNHHTQHKAVVNVRLILSILNMQPQEAMWSLWRGQQWQLERCPRHLGALALQETQRVSREVQVPAPTHLTHLCPAAVQSRSHRGESNTWCSLPYQSNARSKEWTTRIMQASSV